MADEQTVFEIQATRPGFINWGELRRYKELFYFFTWRDIKIKYKQTVLGFSWAILQPLLMMLVFTFFFGRALKVPSENLPYPIFVLSGLLVWNIFSTGLTGASNGMVSNAAIIKKIYFPRLIIPVSAILCSFFDFLMAFLLYAGLLLYFRQPVSWSALWCWPLSLTVTFVATLGLGTLFGALNVKYRDFRYVIPFAVQILLFLTPVIYPVGLLTHPFLKFIVAASPVYSAIELMRYPLTHLMADGNLMAVSLISAVVCLLIGLIYFKRTEDFFADIV